MPKANRKRIVVLGAGRVGGVVARELAREKGFEVTVADLSEAALAKAAKSGPLKTVQADLSDASAIPRLVEPFDCVAGALPGWMGFKALRAVIEAGKDCCDISFMPEDALLLDGLARETGATVVFDMGVAPGMSNMLIGSAVAEFERTDRVRILVGGLPPVRCWPFQYKAPFSPVDVIEEYTRPARLVENGKPVEKPALSEPEMVEFPGLGTFEAFNTDGLRSLIRTVKAPFMVEKTLRWPGHRELMLVLRESGFFDEKEVEVKGVQVRPVDLTSKLLFRQWAFAEGEEDFTIMRVEVQGRKDGKSVCARWDLFDRYDPETRTLSMARTTGFPAAIVAALIARGRFTRPGVIPPEELGRDPEILRAVMTELARRGVRFASIREEE
jgi:lysine 6-dehydrogenase